MRKIVDSIKDHSFSDYRLHMSAVVCDIVECNQYVGLHSVLKVSPRNYDVSIIQAPDEIKHFNVVCSGTVGVYGFPTNLKELYYAYVLTDNPSEIEGNPALIVPKSFLMGNPGDDYAVEPDALSKEELKKLRMRKENLIRSRKFS